MNRSETDDEQRAGQAEALLSDEPTIELVLRAQRGDTLAVEAILERCLPKLRRWAHGRLPAAARAALDTNDLVQEIALHALTKLGTFEVRHVGAMQAYLRRSVINRIRDEVRRIGRRPEARELPDDLISRDSSPIEEAIKTETYQRYCAALAQLRARDRELIIARIDLQWDLDEITERFGFATTDAARMGIKRALERLRQVLRR